MGSTTISYALTDYLGGTNVIANSSGTVVETLGYYPYGALRLDNTTSGYSGEQRKYIGQQYDAATQLDYLNARYYNSAQGQFISQDPVFVAGPLGQNLEDPQSLNAYSYSEDNPITKEDPTGKLTNAQISAILGSISSILQGISSLLGGGISSNGPGIGSGNAQSTPSVANKSSGSAAGGFGTSGYSSITVPGQWVTQMPDLTGCFTACTEMLGYTPKHSVNTQVYNAEGGLSPTQTAGQGYGLIDLSLSAGQRVMVGVHEDSHGDVGNANAATNHFVVINGRNEDAKGEYYTFQDPGTSNPATGNSSQNRLYVTPNGLQGTTAYSGINYTVTQVLTK